MIALKRTNLLIIFVLSTFVLSFMPTTLGDSITVDPYGEDVKIGFSWINGLIGASELIDMGYAKAQFMGAEIEHREYRWDFLDYDMLLSISEWNGLYLSKYPDLETSVALSVITGNSTAIPITLDLEYDFVRYTASSVNVTRINDTLIMNSLKNMTMGVMNIVNPTYISFGSEINGLFESYYDSETNTLTDTAMLEDYVDLCEQMYDFIKVNYSDTKVLTIFRYQPPDDIQNIRLILPYFEDACDIFGVSTRIFTDIYGFNSMLDEAGVLDRFTSFANLSSKKFAITNAYTISDSRAGGSEFYQENYVRYLFNVIKEYEDELEFLCWYTVFDYPPGYLTTFFNPFLEAHATAGLCTHNGDEKRSYHAWIEEMRIMGRLPDYRLPWKTAVASLTIIAVIGFLGYAYVMEGLQFRKDHPKAEKIKIEEPVDEPSELTLEAKKPKRSRKQRSKTLEFSSNGLAQEESDAPTEDVEATNDE